MFGFLSINRVMSFSSFYHRLKSNPQPEPYLNFPMSFNRKRLFCQLRLHPDRLKCLSIYADGNKFEFAPTTLCTICRLPENDDLFHFACRCVIFDPLCSRMTNFPNIRTTLLTHRLFNNYDCEYVKD